MQVCFVTHHTGFDPDTISGTWLEDTVASYQSTGTASSPLKPQDEMYHLIGARATLVPTETLSPGSREALSGATVCTHW